MLWQATIWVILVLAVSVALLLGVLALTNRIQAIDSRLAELRVLELELTRTLKWALTNHLSDLNAIKLRLDELSSQRDSVRKASLDAQPPETNDTAELAAPAASEQVGALHSEQL